MAVDRLPDGSWALCETEACDARFHLPGLSVEEAEHLPFGMLLQLLEVIDPPTSVVTYAGSKVWADASRGLHRDYDLPALIRPDGSMHWLRNGGKHRDGGKPAVMYPDGRREWWVGNKMHREGGPALIYPDGKMLWYLNDAPVGTGPQCEPIDYSQGWD